MFVSIGDDFLDKGGKGVLVHCAGGSRDRKKSHLWGGWHPGGLPTRRGCHSVTGKRAGQGARPTGRLTHRVPDCVNRSEALFKKLKITSEMPVVGEGIPRRDGRMSPVAANVAFSGST